MGLLCLLCAGLNYFLFFSKINPQLDWAYGTLGRANLWTGIPTSLFFVSLTIAPALLRQLPLRDPVFYCLTVAYSLQGFCNLGSVVLLSLTALLRGWGCSFCTGWMGEDLSTIAVQVGSILAGSGGLLLTLAAGFFVLLQHHDDPQHRKAYVLIAMQVFLVASYLFYWPLFK